MERKSLNTYYRAVAHAAYGPDMMFFFNVALKKLTDTDIQTEKEALHRGRPTELLLSLGAGKLYEGNHKLLCQDILAGDLKGIIQLFS
jgi:hypothetical protein